MTKRLYWILLFIVITSVGIMITSHLNDTNPNFTADNIHTYSLAEDFPESLKPPYESKLEEKIAEKDLKKFRGDHVKPIPNPNPTPVVDDKGLLINMQKRSAKLGGVTTAMVNNCQSEVLISGKLQGTWKEFGGYQYGAIFNTAYDNVGDKVYAMSNGGHIWRGNRDGSGYVSLNDKYRLWGLNDVFNVVNKNGRPRIFALPRYAKKELHFSDDDGITWRPCPGIDITGIHHTEPISLRKTSSGNLYYHVRSIQPGPVDIHEIFYSDNNGDSWRKVLSEENSDNSKLYFMDVWIPVNGERVFVLDNKNKKVHEINAGNVVGTQNYGGIPNNGRVRLVGMMKGSQPIFYLLDNYDKLYKSTDKGASWSFFADNPLHQGLFNYWRSLSVDPQIEDKLFYGSAHTYIWDIPTRTWRDITTTEIDGVMYYDISGKIHWDSESLKVFQAKDGRYFSLYGGHGGLEISYNQWDASTFLGKNQMGISTYYGHETTSGGIFWGGTQDRAAHFSHNGFSESCSIEPMRSLLNSSGDMTEVYLTENRTVAWTMAVGGFLTIDLETDSGKASRNERDFCEVAFSEMLNGQHWKGWDPAKYINHNQNRDYIFYGGGNINGPDGSFIIKITPDRSKQIGVIDKGGRRFDVKVEQYPYDFKANSFTNTGINYITSIGQSNTDANRMYVGMLDGSFFFSNDAGINWSRSSVRLQTDCYAMALSRNNKDVVYVAGLNAILYKSTDGGLTFTQANTTQANRPVEYILDMEFGPNENLLFVGGRSGAFAYETNIDQWHNIQGQHSPDAEYRDVDYVPEINTMRWSVWSRGIFDLKLDGEFTGGGGGGSLGCPINPGNIRSNSDEVCGGAGSIPAGFFNLEGHDGTVAHWEYKLDATNWIVWFGGNVTTSQAIDVNGPDRMHVRAKIVKNGCADVYTPTRSISIKDCGGGGSVGCPINPGNIRSNSDEVCGGVGSIPAGFFNLEGHDGTVAHWEYKLDATNWIVWFGGNVTTSQAIDVNGPDRMHVRAKIVKNGCADVYTPTRSISIKDCGGNCPTIPGNIRSNSDEVCGGVGSIPAGFFNLEGHDGTVAHWEYKLDATNWIVWFGGNVTTSQAIDVNGPDRMHVRAKIVKNGCADVYTPTRSISIKDCGGNCPTIPGNIRSNSDEVCGGVGSIPAGFFNLEGHRGTIIHWEYKLDNTDWIVWFGGDIVSSLPGEVYGPNTMHVRVKVQENGCAEAYTATKTIKVNDCTPNVECPTIPGVVRSNGDEVCGGPGSFPAGFFTLDGHRGTIIHWEYKLDNTDWIVWFGGDLVSSLPGEVGGPNTMHVRVKVQENGCAEAYTATKTIKVNDCVGVGGANCPTIPGVVRSNIDEVCGGPGSFPAGFFTLEGHRGTIIHWEYKLDNTDWIVWFGGNLVSSLPGEVGGPNTMHVRVKVQENGCAEAYTATKTIRVNDCTPNVECPTIPGVIKSNSDEVCAGVGNFPAGFFHIEGHSGTIIHWEYRLDNTDWIVWFGGDIAASLPGEVIGANNFHVRAKVQKSGCAELYTPVKTVKVNQVVAGTLRSNADEVCGGPGSFPAGFFNLEGHSGDVIQWEFRLDNTNWIFWFAGDTTSSLPGEVGGPNNFHVRVKVGDGGCNDKYSSVKTVRVNGCNEDADEDGVRDIEDLDDDNDGILDTVEDNCGVTKPLNLASNTDGLGDYNLPEGVSVQVSGSGSSSDQSNERLKSSTTSGQEVRYVFTVPSNSLLRLGFNGLDSDVERISISGNMVSSEIHDTHNLSNGVLTGTSGSYSYITFSSGTITLISSSSVTSSRFIGPAEVVISSECDLDGDGIINSLDTDADGDGCADAIEGSGSFTSSDIDGGDMLTGGVDADGVPIKAQGGQVIGEAQDSEKVSIICNGDADEDGVRDIEDLDDDNDGILDTVEDNCGVTKPLNLASNTDGLGDYNLPEGVSVQVSGSGSSSDQSNERLKSFTTSGQEVRYVFTVPSNSLLRLGFNGLDSDVERISISGNMVSSEIHDTHNLSNGVLTGTSGSYSYITFSGGTVTLISSSSVTSSRFIGPAEVVISSECDLDGDGITNSLDTDSDGDGCADAIEGSGSFTSSDIDGGDMLTGGVDADGVPTVATASGQMVGDAQDSTIESCTDTDGDGIADSADLDDDNDGILDTDECSGEVSVIVQVVTLNASSGTFTDNSGQTINWSSNEPHTVNLPDLFAENVMLLADGDNMNYTFNTPVNGLALIISGMGPDNIVSSFNEGMDLSINGIDVNLNTLIASGIVDLMTITELQANGNGSDAVMGIIDADGNINMNNSVDASGLESAVGLKFNTPVSSLAGIVFGQTFIGASILVFTPHSASSCDADEDGIPNNLDTDSDNDGCADAIEGSGTFTSIDIDANDRLIGSVNTDGVPTLAVSGQGLGVSQNADSNSCIIVDSDGDGVADDDDICPGHDDSADNDNDGIPNGCDDCNGNLIGQSCDDGDLCTSGETYDSACNCIGGTVVDTDNDDVCDAEDACPNMDDNLIGQPCDDGDPCTTGETYDSACSCIGGTVVDADNDGVCDAEDVCPNMDDNLIGQSCDDGDPCTTGETYDSACSCIGGTVVDADNDGVCAADDTNDNDPCIPDDSGCDTSSSEECELISSHGFENGDMGIWNDGGSKANLLNSTGFANTGSGSFYIYDDTGVGSSLYTEVLDLSSYDIVNMSFNLYPYLVENDDLLYIEYSTDGSSYAIIKTLANEVDFTSGQRNDIQIQINLSAYPISNLRLRSAAGPSDYYIIDDIVIEACSITNGQNNCLIGQSCDDGDPCTTGETYDSDCNCIGGTVVDADNDGVCAADDANDNDPCIPDDSGCDTSSSEECEVISSHGFESGDMGIWNDGGSKANLLNSTGFANTGSGSFYIYDDTGVGSSLYTEALDLSSYDIVNLSFNLYPYLVENDDLLYIEYSTDGSSYAIIKTLANEVDFTSGQRNDIQIQINLSAYPISNLRLRSAAGPSDYYIIDDIVLEACSITNGQNNCLIGQSCDDGDPCTIGETYDSDCNCIGGTVVDADNDGVCAADDANDNDPCIPDDSGCDTSSSEECELISSHGFENGDMGIWNDGGSKANLLNSTGFANTGSGSFYIYDDTDVGSSLYTEALDLSSYDIVNMSFNLYPYLVENDDLLYIEYSTDGSSYAIIKTLANEVDFTSGQRNDIQIQINLSAYPLSNLRLRSAAGPSDYYIIDDIVIEACRNNTANDNESLSYQAGANENNNENAVMIDQDASSFVMDVYEAQTKDGISIYPNPANNYVKLDLNNKNEEIVEVTIFSLDGSKSHTIKGNYQSNFQIDIGCLGLSNQVYIISVEIENGYHYVNRLYINN